jgi:DNA-binding response OmpR family regulator
MLTSKGSRFDKVRGAMSGCDMYLTKPPQDSKLKEILDRRCKILHDSIEQVVKVNNSNYR